MRRADVARVRAAVLLGATVAHAGRWSAMHSARYSACVVPKSLLNRYDFAHTLVSQLRGFGTNRGFYLLVYRSVTCQPRSCEPHHIMTHSALLIYSASSILVIGLPGKRQYPAEISFTVRVLPATGSQYRMGAPRVR